MNQQSKSLSTLFTVFSFIVTQVLAPVPGLAISITASPNSERPARFEFSIPSTLGTIEELISGNDQTLIHIQTAHGNYEAQKNIQEILHHLKNNYGFDTLLLEGSSSRLRPEILRLYPDRMDITMGIADRLTKKALVKGPGLFLLEAEDAEAYGIEDVDTYVRNGVAFKAVLKQQDATENFLRDMDMQIERLTSPYLNKDLRAFLTRLENFEDKRIPIEQWLGELKKQGNELLRIDLGSPNFQLDWPMLVRVFKLQEFEKKIDARAYAKERKSFLKDVKKTTSKEDYESIERLLTSPLSRHQLAAPDTALLFERMVEALPKDYKFEKYSNVNDFIGHLILQSELKGDMLMDEMDKITDKITDQLAKTEIEKQIVELLKDHRLLHKLFGLQLTPNEYESILSRGAEIFPMAVIDRFLSLNGNSRVKNVSFKNIDDIMLLFTTALNFYQTVKERDLGMLRNAENRMKQLGVKKAVVVTGGFHAEPFKNYFASKNFNYALITPTITSTDGLEAYHESVLHNEPNIFQSQTRETVWAYFQDLPQLRVMGADSPDLLKQAAELSKANLEESAVNNFNAGRFNGTEASRIYGVTVARAPNAVELKVVPVDDGYVDEPATIQIGLARQTTVRDRLVPNFNNVQGTVKAAASETRNNQGKPSQLDVPPDTKARLLARTDANKLAAASQLRESALAKARQRLSQEALNAGRQSSKSETRVEKYGDRVNIYDDRDSMGEAAAEFGVQKIEQLLREQETVRIVFAAAPSQVETIAALVRLSVGRVDWRRVEIFHMDEFSGFSPPHEVSFRTWLNDNLINPLIAQHAEINSREDLNINFIEADSKVKADLTREAKRYSALLAEKPVDIVFGGYGYNGHVAFNDPPAKFAPNTNTVLVVDPSADPVNAQQQIEAYPNDFQAAADIPLAVTISIPAMADAKYMIMTVPGDVKAAAMRDIHSHEGNAVNAPRNRSVPGTFFNKLPADRIQVFTEQGGASLLPGRSETRAEYTEFAGKNTLSSFLMTVGGLAYNASVVVEFNGARASQPNSVTITPAEHKNALDGVDMALNRKQGVLPFNLSTDVAKVTVKSETRVVEVTEDLRLWANQMFDFGHVFSLDLPKFSDLRSFLPALIKNKIIYSATTNNNGNLGYLREIVDSAKQGKNKNPITAELERILEADETLREPENRDKAIKRAYENLVNQFVARLAIEFEEIYVETNGRHGYVSTELPTEVVLGEDNAENVRAVVETGFQRFTETQKEIEKLIGRTTRNLLLKIPATDLGLKAGEALIAQGYSVNFTLVATAEQYRATVQAHKRGIQKYVETFVSSFESSEGRRPTGEELVAAMPQSVSSDFVSRDDRNVAPILEDESFEKMIAHLNTMIAAGHEVDKNQELLAKYRRLQALTAEQQATNTEYQTAISEFRDLRNDGPERVPNTTKAALAFAQANIGDIWSEEYEQDNAWIRFLADNFGTTVHFMKPNDFVSQQVYWASTGVKVDGQYTTEPYYLGELVAENTTDTVPRAVVVAIIESGNAPFTPAPISDAKKQAGRQVLTRLADLGVDLGYIKNKIIFPDGLKDFDGSDRESYEFIGTFFERALRNVNAASETRALDVTRRDFLAGLLAGAIVPTPELLASARDARRTPDTDISTLIANLQSDVDQVRFNAVHDVNQLISARRVARTDVQELVTALFDTLQRVDQIATLDAYKEIIPSQLQNQVEIALAIQRTLVSAQKNSVLDPALEAIRNDNVGSLELATIARVLQELDATEAATELGRALVRGVDQTNQSQNVLDIQNSNRDATNRVVAEVLAKLNVPATLASLNQVAENIQIDSLARTTSLELLTEVLETISGLLPNARSPQLREQSLEVLRNRTQTLAEQVLNLARNERELEALSGVQQSLLNRLQEEQNRAERDANRPQNVDQILRAIEVLETIAQSETRVQELVPVEFGGQGAFGAPFGAVQPGTARLGRAGQPPVIRQLIPVVNPDETNLDNLLVPVQLPDFNLTTVQNPNLVPALINGEPGLPGDPIGPFGGPAIEDITGPIQLITVTVPASDLDLPELEDGLVPPNVELPVAFFDPRTQNIIFLAPQEGLAIPGFNPLAILNGLDIDVSNVFVLPGGLQSAFGILGQDDNGLPTFEAFFGQDTFSLTPLTLSNLGIPAGFQNGFATEQARFDLNPFNLLQIFNLDGFEGLTQFIQGFPSETGITDFSAPTIAGIVRFNFAQEVPTLFNINNLQLPEQLEGIARNLGLDNLAAFLNPANFETFVNQATQVPGFNLDNILAQVQDLLLPLGLNLPDGFATAPTQLSFDDLGISSDLVPALGVNDLLSLINQLNNLGVQGFANQITTPINGQPVTPSQAFAIATAITAALANLVPERIDLSALDVNAPTLSVFEGIIGTPTTQPTIADVLNLTPDQITNAFSNPDFSVTTGPNNLQTVFDNVGLTVPGFTRPNLAPTVPTPVTNIVPDVVPTVTPPQGAPTVTSTPTLPTLPVQPPVVVPTVPPTQGPTTPVTPGTFTEAYLAVAEDYTEYVLPGGYNFDPAVVARFFTSQQIWTGFTPVYAAEDIGTDQLYSVFQQIVGATGDVTVVPTENLEEQIRATYSEFTSDQLATIVDTDRGLVNFVNQNQGDALVTLLWMLDVAAQSVSDGGDVEGIYHVVVDTNAAPNPEAVWQGVERLLRNQDQQTFARTKLNTDIEAILASARKLVKIDVVSPEALAGTINDISQASEGAGVLLSQLLDVESFATFLLEDRRVRRNIQAIPHLIMSLHRALTSLKGVKIKNVSDRYDLINGVLLKETSIELEALDRNGNRVVYRITSLQKISHDMVVEQMIAIQA